MGKNYFTPQFTVNEQQNGDFTLQFLFQSGILSSSDKLFRRAYQRRIVTDILTRGGIDDRHLGTAVYDHHLQGTEEQ